MECMALPVCVCDRILELFVEKLSELSKFVMVIKHCEQWSHVLSGSLQKQEWFCFAEIVDSSPDENEEEEEEVVPNSEVPSSFSFLYPVLCPHF